MINEELPLTFGVELELVFVFHEDKLKKILSQKPSTAGATIVKKMSDEERAELGEGRRYQAVANTLPRQYNSWGLENAGKHPSEKAVGSTRRYHIEPLEIVKEVLLPIRPNIRIHEEEKKPEDLSIFLDWHVTNDYSLIGIDKEQMIKDFPDRIVDLAAAEAWDSLGVEVVSRVLRDVVNAEPEIEGILGALKGDSTSLHGATLTEHCAMHVHVGRGDQGFPLPTLQHLAYLLVVYEREIEKIHPITLRYGSSSSATDTRSNLENFYVEAKYEILWVLKNGVLEQREVPIAIDTLAEVRRRIFEVEGSTIRGLVDLMSPYRGRVVNFRYLVEQGRPRTVEFRAHDGCLNAEEVKYWVMFVQGLIRLADQYANTGGFCPVREWNNHTSFWDLLEEMRFPVDGVAHLKAKAAYNVEWPPKAKELPEDYTPPASDASNGGNKSGDNSSGNDQVTKDATGAGTGDSQPGQDVAKEQKQSSTQESGIRKGEGTGYHKDSSDEGVRDFEAIIAKGYGKIPTSASGLLCGAIALATSLRAVRFELGHTQSPTRHQLLSIIQSDEYKAVQRERMERLFGGDLDVDQDEQEREALKAELEAQFHATYELTAEQLILVLGMVGQQLGQSYRLGLCTVREGKHQVYISNTSEESVATDPVVWIHNDGHELGPEEPDEAQDASQGEPIRKIGHWSGIAPGGTLIIVPTKDKPVSLREQPNNFASSIGESAGHGATESKKRKHGDMDEGETQPAKKAKH